ncbi:MAG: hypothetical protein GYB65_22930 [Chloroflexi bacterium]|nr:hypothetical protein [Chloroflexota bacterium]
MPGTWTILRLLIWTPTVPVYARGYWQDRLFHPRPTLPGLGTFNFMGMFAALLIMPGLLMAWLVLLWGDVIGLAWVAAGLGLLTAVAGPALIAQRTSRTISHERQTHTWETLLVVPDDRMRVVLFAVRHAVAPPLAWTGLALVLLAALLLSPPATGCAVVRCGLLVVEWCQLLAFSVALGLLHGIHAQRVNGLIALVLGLGVIAGRAGIGWLAATSAAQDTQRAALLVGPLVHLTRVHPTALTLAVLYLLGLEGLVRGVAGWSLNHAGER